MSDQEADRNEVSEGAPAVPQVSAKSGFDAQDIEKHKGIACLSYVSLLFLVPLLTEKESRFAQFHAKQGMALFIAWVVIALMLRTIPMFGGFILVPVLNLAFIVVSVIAIIKTLGGEAWEIPGASLITKKLNF